jgi:hypothetical protein
MKIINFDHTHFRSCSTRMRSDFRAPFAHSRALFARPEGASGYVMIARRFTRITGYRVLTRMDL